MLDEWTGYANKLPSFAKESLVDAALDKIPEKVIEAGMTAAAGVSTATMLGALPVIAITFAGSENSDTKSSGNSGTTGRGRRR